MRAAVAVRTIAYLIAILVVGRKAAQLLRSGGEVEVVSIRCIDIPPTIIIHIMKNKFFENYIKPTTENDP